MKRECLEIILKQNSYLKGGTKEACVKVREFLHYAINSDGRIKQSDLSCVSLDEFIEATKILMAYASLQEDEIPKTWCCDVDCKRTTEIFCPGECNINKKSGELCPFFIDESLI